MATGIRGTQIRDETVESVDIASGSIKAGELHTQVITGQTAETSVAGDDLVLIYDTSATAFRKMTKSNFTAGVTASPAGSDGQLQYNNNSSAGGASGLYYDDANNRVGIGTSSPQALLHVTSSVDGDTLFRATPHNQSNDGFNIIDSAGSTYVTINKAGQSTYPLDVNGNIRSGMHLSTIDGTSYGFRVGASQHHLYGVAEGSTDQGSVMWMKDNGGFVISGSTTSSPLRVQTSDNANILVVSGSGNIGIGTSTPSTLLDVSGSAKANTFVTTPALTDLGSATATHLTSSNGVHFLDADSVTLESGKNYHELYLAPGSTNGQHIQLAITSSANNPVKLMGDTAGAKAQGTVSFSGAAANGQTVSFPNVGGATTYTVTWDTSIPAGEWTSDGGANVGAGCGGISSANDFASIMNSSIDLGISSLSWPFTLVGTYAGGSTATLAQTSAGTSGNQTITENSDNTTVTGFSGGTALIEGTINSAYGIALAGTSANGSLIQGAHLIYDSNSQQWQVIAGTQLTS